MASSVRLDTLRTRVRERTHLENGGFASDAEVNRLINVHRQRLHLRIARAVPYWYATDYTVSIVAGTIAYAVPSDFLFLQSVHIIEAADRFRPLRTITDVASAGYQSPQASKSARLRYTPVPAQLANDSDTLDGIIGLDEWVVCACARSLKVKEETEWTAVGAEMAEIERDILSAISMHDQGSPVYVSEVEGYDAAPYFDTAGINGYQLRAGYLDFYSAALPWL